MRIANLAGRAHLVTGDRVLDIGAVSEGRFPADPMDLFAHWGELSAWAGRVDHVDSRPYDPRALQAPAPRPRQVFAVASNYRDRPTVLEAPADLPVTFTKFPGCVVGPYADVPLPTETVDWEVELVVVVGRAAHRISTAEAWSVVAGLTVGQDISERTLQLGGPTKQFSLGKSFPNFGPTGPLLVTPDELAEKDNLRLRCSVNDEVVQDGRTSQLIFSVSELVSRLSVVCTLFPGDLIFTGTPGGLGMMMTPPRYLRAGDRITSQIEGIGEMSNLCVMPTAVTG